MAQTKPKAGQFYGVSGNGTDGQFLQTDGTGGMAWADTTIDPTLTSIDYPGTQTAADPAGGESIIINGTGFQTGITCTVGGTSATTVFNSATQITITSPAKAAGQYTVLVTNTDGGSGSSANFIQYSGVPVWSTNSGSLGSVTEGGTTSFQVTATEGSDTIEYAVTSGSLPSGYSLATATGAITGTAGAVSADTTSTFSITATDDENQTSSARSFSITVTNLGPGQFINTRIYTGNGSNAGSYPSIGGSLDVATDFTPDLVIVKARNAATGWVVGDSVRGNYGYMYLNSTSASGSACGGYGSNPCGGANGDGGIGIGTNKFIVKDDGSGNYGVSGPGTLYQSFAWKAGGAPTTTNSGGQTPTSGSKMIDGSASTTNFATATEYPSKQTISTAADFSMSLITKTTATGSLQVPHGLSGAPDFVILKMANGSDDWLIYHTSVGTGKYLSTTRNEQGGGAGTDTPITNANSFSTINADIIQNKWTNSNWYWMCYAWKTKAGFSKFDTYTGNGSANGPIVETGFEPAIIIIKRTDASANWVLLNNATSTTNPRTKITYPNESLAEQTGNQANFLENGFQIIATGADRNASGGTYVYAAWGADPSTTTPSLANSFATELYTGNSSTQQVTSGFRTDLVFIKARSAVNNWVAFDTVRGMVGNPSYRLVPSTNSAQSNWATTAGISAADATSITVKAPGGQGYGLNESGVTQVAYTWKSGGVASINTSGAITSLVSVNQAAGVSVVKWTGSGSAATVGHGLGAIPQLIIVKNLDATEKWRVYNNTSGATKYMSLNDDYGTGTASTIWNDTTPTSTVFSTGSDASVSGSGNGFVAYCWTSIANYCKVGTYSGSSSAHTVAIGFAPSFAIIKRTDTTGSWRVFDTTRGTDKSLSLNSDGAEYDDSVNYMDYTSTGFSFSTSQQNPDINASSGEYIYIAFKEN